MKRMLSLFLAISLLFVCVMPLSSCGGTEDSEGTDGLAYSLSLDGTYCVSVGDATEASKIVIPSEHNGIKVTVIDPHGFEKCTALKTIIIPESVEFIGFYAFYGCTELTSVTIPDSVTVIGEYAFYGCKGLTSLTIPDSVTRIGFCAFYGCKGLTSLTIPDSVTTISDHAFDGCTGLTSVTIPDSVTTIGRYAFYGCKGLRSVTFANTIGWKAGDMLTLLPSALADASTAATYLTDNYINFEWTRK